MRGKGRDGRGVGAWDLTWAQRVHSASPISALKPMGQRAHWRLSSGISPRGQPQIPPIIGTCPNVASHTPVTLKLPYAFPPMLALTTKTPRNGSSMRTLYFPGVSGSARTSAAKSMLPSKFVTDP
eukprot:1131738-Prymnesium_polylepis.1